MATTAQFAVQPRLASADGAVATASQADALRAALSLVDRFRVVVKNLDGEVVADETLEVSGAPPYELSLSVPLRRQNQEFDVELTALAGATRLFQAGPIRVRAVPEDVRTAPTLVDAELEYVGPGATAASIELEPGVMALAPGGTATLEATVRDEGGNVQRGVPLVFSPSDEGLVETGDDGTVTGVADGQATVEVVAPNGTSASATVYVVDGTVAFVRGGGIYEAPAGGEAEQLVDAGGHPAWSGDGSTLFYVRGGTVHQMGGGMAGSGSWPSVSPDGTKLAVERGGQVYFMNLDGSNAIQGPSGSQPVWAPGGSALFVSGGSLERVHASGGSRETVAEDGTAPAVAAGGRLAYRGGDGGIYVDGTRVSAEDESSSSRPTLSANGRWVVFESDGELRVAPADGSGAPVSLGVGRGSDPAWRGHGFTEPPPEVELSEISPESPKVGDEVTISGSGFDWIIPSNNQVSFPDRSSAVSGANGAPALVTGPIVNVTSTSITAVVPENVAPGLLVVETRTGQASIDFEPAGATLAVRAETESGGPVAGVGVTASDGNGNAFSATTGEDGTATIEDLAAGTYGLEWSTPEGFGLVEAPTSVDLPWSQTSEVTAVLEAEVVDFELEPAETRVEVAESVDLQVKALDALGNEVTGDVESSWRALISRVEVDGSGLSGTLTGVHPSAESGDARFEVTVEGIEKRFNATVTSWISGRVVDGSGNPLEGIEVTLSGETSASTETDAEGHYRFGDLFAGDYTVKASPPQGHEAQPPSHDITLWEANPTGQANFKMVKPEQGPQGFSLLVTTVNGLEVVDKSGNRFVLRSNAGSAVEVLGERIFISSAGRILELDLNGQVIGETVISPDVPFWLNFVALPGGGFALLDNRDDMIYFVGSDGSLQSSVAIPVPENNHLQNISGAVVDGRLIVSETGNGEVLEVDLATKQATIFRQFSGGLSDIDHQNGTFFLARSSKVQTFTETGPLTDLVSFGSEYNVIGVAAVGDHLYSALNFAGKLYRTDIETGNTELVVDGLDSGSPKQLDDMEFLPVDIVPK